MRPAMLWANLVSVEFGIYAHAAKRIGQLEHPVRMLGRIMAVADEDRLGAHDNAALPEARQCDEGSLAPVSES